MTDSILSPVKTHSPAELHQLARSALAKGDFDAAEATLGIAFALDENDTEAMIIMAESLEARGEKMEAVGYAVLAINTDNEKTAAKKKFLRLAHDMSFTHHNPKIESALLACLKTPGLECSGAYVLWGNAVFVNPVLGELFVRILRKRFLPFGNPFDDLADFVPLLEPLFLLGLRKNVVCFTPFEAFVTHLRRFVLDQYGSKKPKIPAAEQRKLAEALARYCFHAEYIMEITPPEQKAVNVLRARIESGEAAADAEAVTLLACYEPLHSLKNSSDVKKNFNGGDAGELVDEQITEYGVLKQKAEALVPTPLADEVSEKVRGMYEQFPYPRWREIEEEAARWRAKDAIALSGKDTRALVAGCGTGREACQLAAGFLDAQITGIDISRASLAYAAMKAEQYGLKNLELRHVDILALDASEKSYDYIYCVGVLQHMREPEKGWEILANLLKPDGTMFIGLYGETPRGAALEARAAIEKGKYAATIDDMRRFRKDAPKLLSADSLAVLHATRDYYFLSMFNDLLFHVHEDRFTIPRIKAAIGRLGLVFLGFKLPDSLRDAYRQQFPDDRDGLSLDNWENFEKVYPDSFIDSYQFWCRKKDKK